MAVAPPPSIFRLQIYALSPPRLAAAELLPFWQACGGGEANSCHFGRFWGLQGVGPAILAGSWAGLGRGGPEASPWRALFAETETRAVGRDYAVRWKNGFWQIPEAAARAAGVRPGLPGLRIVVERRLSGELRFRRDERCFAARAARSRASCPSGRVSGPASSASEASEPGPHHPWRKQIRDEVERAVARRERPLARLAASNTAGDGGEPASSGACGDRPRPARP